MKRKKSGKLDKTQRQLIVSFVLVCLLGTLLVTSLFGFGWFSKHYTAESLNQTFVSANPSDARFAMWTYDSLVEGGNNEWTCKASDYHIESDEYKQAAIAIRKNAGDDNYSVSISNLAFGEITDLVNESQDNDVYMRVAVNRLSHAGDNGEIEFSLPRNYAKCFQSYPNNETILTDVTSALNNTLSSELSGDSISNINNHIFFSVEYQIVPIGYASVGSVEPREFLQNPDKYYVKTVIDGVTSYEPAEHPDPEETFYIATTETDPKVGDDKEDADWNGMTENGWNKLFTKSSDLDTANSRTVSFDIPDADRYFIFFRFRTNIQNNGIRSVLKNLYQYMPCYLSFDVKLSISVHN